jgi:hypothetical protein
MLSGAILIAIGLAAEAAGTHSEKPACTVATRGLMWPLDANGDGKVAVLYSRRGLLEICTKGPWKHHWETPVVHVKQLKKVRSLKQDVAP